MSPQDPDQFLGGSGLNFSKVLNVQGDQGIGVVLGVVCNSFWYLCQCSGFAA